mgnify:CR=1 FL=1|jgi:hypothetical protein
MIGLLDFIVIFNLRVGMDAFNFLVCSPFAPQSPDVPRAEEFGISAIRSLIDVGL